MKIRSPWVLGAVWGNVQVEAQVRAGESAAEIEAGWADALRAFGERRERSLIYR